MADPGHMLVHPLLLGFRVHPLSIFFYFFFHFKKVSYICALLSPCIYKMTLSCDRAYKYIQLCLLHRDHNYRDYSPIYILLHRRDHQKRLFLLKFPTSSITSFIKNPASSWVTPSRRSSGRSFSRKLLTYIRKGDQYEYINHDNKN